MYVWLWRTLPGGTPGKVAGVVVLAAVVVALLFLVIFPWLEDNLALLSDVTVDPEPSAGTLPEDAAG